MSTVYIDGSLARRRCAIGVVTASITSNATRMNALIEIASTVQE